MVLSAAIPFASLNQEEGQVWTYRCGIDGFVCLLLLFLYFNFLGGGGWRIDDAIGKISDSYSQVSSLSISELLLSGCMGKVLLELHV